MIPQPVVTFFWYAWTLVIGLALTGALLGVMWRLLLSILTRLFPD